MIRFQELESLGLCVAAMSERLDGDCRSDSASHRAVLCERLGIASDALRTCEQMHGARVVVAGNDGTRPVADGLVTDQAGVALSLTVADCVPLFLAEPSRRVIALVHAGREGTFQRIATAAVTLLRDEFACDPECLHAMIGPSAGPERYEVSTELASRWRAAGLPLRGRRNLDLWESNRQQLLDGGMLDENIHVCGICTIEDMRFFSYRRGDAHARNAALLML